MKRVRTAFVTGSTGFVGLNLIKLLIERRWRVVAFHRADSDLRFLGQFPIEHAVGDIGDFRTLARVMPADPDAVFHVAGSSNLWARRNAEQTRVNVEGTQRVVEAALVRGARKFVFCSSWVAYGVQPQRFNEEAPQLGGISWVNHFRTKYLAEQRVREGIAKGLDASIINPSLILGPYDQTGWARMIRLIYSGNLPGIPPGTVNFCDVREVAKAHLAAAELGRCGQNYLLGGPDTRFVDLFQTIGKVIGRRVRGTPVPGWLLRTMAAIESFSTVLRGGGEPRLTPEVAFSVSRKMSCDSALAERELGYRAVDLETMVMASFCWLRDEGFLNAPTR